MGTTFRTWKFVFSAAAICCQLAAQAPQTTRYYLVFLRPDPARKALEKSDGERIQSAHMANIHKMAADGILFAAGPFEDDVRTISGIFVFKTGSLESAREIAAQDPTVLEHRNTVDVHAWEGPAGIGDEYFRLHNADPKTPDNMQIHPLAMIYPGPAWNDKAAERESLMAEHGRYIDRLRAAGKLGAAGGIEAPDELAGLVIFKPAPLQDAQKLMADDPAVKAGLLRAEYHNWWSADHVLPW